MNRLVVLVVVLTLAAAGCSPKSAPIIEVGSQVVTVADYEHAAASALGRYMGTPDQAKAEFISDLRRRALLLEQAHRMGYDTSAVLTNSTQDEERRLLLQALYTKLAPQAQPVSEALGIIQMGYEARVFSVRLWSSRSSTRLSAS